MCSTHINRQDGGGGPRGACICKGGHVFKVTQLMKDMRENSIWHVSLCVAFVFVDILWWQSGQWDTSGSSWSWSWSRSGCRTGSEGYHSFHWRTTLKLHLSENVPPSASSPPTQISSAVYATDITLRRGKNFQNSNVQRKLSKWFSDTAICCCNLWR